MNTKNNKIIIDTDPGQDDALAILLLEKSGLFNIKAVTTVAGNSTIKNTTNNARYILDLVGSKTPIYSGAKKPLKRKLIVSNVHGENGLAGAEITKQEKLSNNAVTKIIEIVKQNPGKISILAIAPLTNIAKAFIKEPKLPSLIKEIIIMGGAISVAGNRNKVGEFNIFVDPESADIVFKANVKKALIPLDICEEVFVCLKDFENLKGISLYKPVKKIMSFYIKGMKKFENKAGAFLYDPLAAYYLINPSAYKTKFMDVEVETKSELTRGMTVADRRPFGDKKLNVNVVTSLNKSIFLKDFFKILKKT